MSPFKLKKNLLMGKGKDKDDDDDRDKGKAKIEPVSRWSKPSEEAPQDLDAIEVRTVIHNGKKMRGTFAKREINQGTRILMEVPSLSVNSGTSHFHIYEDFRRLNRGIWPLILDLSRDEDRIKYHLSKLDNVYGMEKLCKKSGASKSEAAKVLAIFDANQVQLQYMRQPDICLRIARINHSCRPNVAISWNQSRKCYVVQALSNIQANKEVFCSYVFLPEPQADRQKQLDKWNFTCTCTACKFNNLSNTDQSLKLTERDRKERPNAKRRSTGEFNQYLINNVEPFALRMDNRMRFFKRQSTAMNDEYVGSRAENYEEMIDLIQLETPAMAEEAARLHQNLAMERAAHAPNIADRDPTKSAKALGVAIALMKICYGVDGDKTSQLIAYQAQQDKQYQKTAAAETLRIEQRRGNVGNLKLVESSNEQTPETAASCD